MLTPEQVAEEAKHHPIEVSVPHPLSYLYLDSDVEVVESAETLERHLDHPSVQFDSNVVLKTQSSYHGSKPYPEVTLDHDPFSPALNNIIMDKYEAITDTVVTQRDIRSELLGRITDEEVVVLIIADGLGYDDVKGTPIEGEPCLVNGPTITPVGYKNVIYGHDETPLVNALNKTRGFMNVLGYSYWDETTYNDLNAAVFENISSITRNRTFEEVLEDLQTTALSGQRTYIQISRRGLDGLVHDGKEVRRADINFELNKLVSDVDELCALLEEQVDSYLVALTADHGILWRDDFESEMKLVEANGKANMRYASQPIGFNGGSAKLLDAFGTTYTVFDYPYVASDFDADQAGTHGGLSYQESLVPLSIHQSPINHD